MSQKLVSRSRLRDIADRGLSHLPARGRPGGGEGLVGRARGEGDPRSAGASSRSRVGRNTSRGA